MIYLDNAATSWPKPPAVARAVVHFLEEEGGNPGRSGHRLSLAAGRAVYNARESVARLFDVADPMRVVFTYNATYALNMALLGMLSPGDRVITTGMEHNSVMRPLRALEPRGVEVIVSPCGSDGLVDMPALLANLSRGAHVLAVQHASNVTGTIQPLAEMAAAAHAAGAVTVVDAAQTAGVLPIDLRTLGVDLLAFTGHKGMLGPTGTGGLVLGDGFDPDRLDTVICGGTGSRSEFETQPRFLPDKFESGTPNGAGLAGLAAALAYLEDVGVETVRAHELSLARRLREGLGNIPGVTLSGPHDAAASTAIVSMRLRGWEVSDIGLALDEDHDILCRVGLHCAPAAHRTLGTFPEGTVRLAPGWFTTPAQIDATIGAISRLASEDRPS